jgi:hypothetical protein
MKKNRAVLAVVAVIVCALTPALPAMAINGQTQALDNQKKMRTHHVQGSQREPRNMVPQNSCDYDRAAGRCMIDLGYGRCVDCSGGPYK